MIGSLRGRLLDRDTRGEVLVEVGGVGYRVTVAPSTLARLGEPGGEVFLWVHHHLREDASVLYGFPGKEERACFEALLGAHGVGPALALAILSVHRPIDLRRALAEDDLAALCLVPGVGRKTAARLLVELKARLDLDLDGAAEAAVVAVAVAGGAGAGGPGGGEPPSPRSDVRAALAGLGYGPDEVRAALRDLPDEGDPALLLRQALQVLAGARTA